MTSKYYQVEEITDESAKKFQEKSDLVSGFVKLMPVNQVLPKVFLKYEDKIRNVECRPDDIWISSFPKCGTTWTQEMVWCIMNDLDYDKAKQDTLEYRVPFFE